MRERIVRKLESLPDDRVYEILDYIDFLESKYARRAAPAHNPIQRLAENVEDTLRAGKASAGAIAGTMNILSKAAGVINGVANAGKSVATDVVNVVTKPSSPPPAQSQPPAGEYRSARGKTTPPGDSRDNASRESSSPQSPAETHGPQGRQRRRAAAHGREENGNGHHL